MAHPPMLRRLFPALLTLVACQQTSPSIDLTVEPLARGTIDVAPPVTTSTIAPAFHLTPPQPLPPPEAQVTLIRDPEGAMAVAALQSLTAHVTVTGATDGDIAIEFIAPGGTIYQRQAQPSANTPLTAQTFDFVLPVAGTWIDSNALTGTWEAVLMFGPAQLHDDTFELTP